VRVHLPLTRFLLLTSFLLLPQRRLLLVTPFLSALFFLVLGQSALFLSLRALLFRARTGGTPRSLCCFMTARLAKVARLRDITPAHPALAWPTMRLHGEDGAAANDKQAQEGAADPQPGGPRGRLTRRRWRIRGWSNHCWRRRQIGRAHV
jgi:hypothetical protein